MGEIKCIKKTCFDMFFVWIYTILVGLLFYIRQHFYSDFFPVEYNTVFIIFETALCKISALTRQVSIKAQIPEKLWNKPGLVW